MRGYGAAKLNIPWQLTTRIRNELIILHEINVFAALMPRHSQQQRTQYIAINAFDVSSEAGVAGQDVLDNLDDLSRIYWRGARFYGEETWWNRIGKCMDGSEFLFR